MLNIVDNFIKVRSQNRLERMLLNGEFPYYYVPESVATDGDYKDSVMEIGDNIVNTPQFCHMFVQGNEISNYFTTVAPISYKLLDTFDGDYMLTRCKVNLNFIDVRLEGKHHVPHIDLFQENQITAIYYVNDSDGDTLFFNRQGEIVERVTPKKGRMVWWEGIKFHAKCSPTKTNERVVINFNYLPRPSVDKPYDNYQEIEL